MMRKGFILSILVLGALSAAMALESVNSREIPDSLDFQSFGSSTARNMQHLNDVVGECANILSSTENADAIDVNKVTADTLVSSLSNLSGVTTLSPKFDSILVNTDGSETVTAALTGQLFVATKSDGATTYTLPDASAATDGCVWVFMQSANQNLVVTATTADNNDFVADNVATSDQVSCATASHLIGAGVVVYGANSKYFAYALNTECPLTVEAAD